MVYGQGRCLNKNSLSTARECRMNLGAPSSETFRKLQSVYTCESGVPKLLSLSHCKFCENSCDAKVKPLVLTDNLKVYPVAFENNETELKPSIQFDERAKVNKGLEDQTRLEYVKGNPYLSKKELEHGIVTVALVLSITALDNNCSLPVAIKYSCRTSKGGDDMKNVFTEQIKILQVYQSCQKYAKDIKLPLRTTYIDLCEIKCRQCIDLKDVCDQCNDADLTYYILPTKPCKRYTESNLQCIKQVVMVLSSDCEEGNK